MATRSVRAALLVALLVVTGISCAAAGDDTSEPDAPIADTRSAARTVDEVIDPADEPTVGVLADDIDPMGVITAAVLLRTGGDVDEALAEGAFSRNDLDAARQGLDDGSLDHLFD